MAKTIGQLRAEGKSFSQIASIGRRQSKPKRTFVGPVRPSSGGSSRRSSGGSSSRSSGGSSGGTKISIVSNAPSDIGKLFGGIKIQSPKQFKSSRRSSGGGGSSRFVGPTIPSSILKTRALKESVFAKKTKTTSSIKKTLRGPSSLLQSPSNILKGSLVRSPLISKRVSTTTNIPTTDKNLFLQSVFRTNPSAFKSLAVGDAVLKTKSSSFQPKDIIGSTKQFSFNKLNGPSGLISKPSQFVNKPLISSLTSKNTITKRGTTTPGKIDTKSFQIVPKNQRQIRERNLNLREASKLLPSLPQDRPGFVGPKRPLTQNRKAELKGLAEFNNTILKQNQINKQLKNLEKGSTVLINENERKKLLQQQTDINSRFRLNPFVSEKNGKFIFTGVGQTVLAGQTITTKQPDVFTKSTTSLFEKGQQSAITGRDRFGSDLVGKGFIKNLQFGAGAFAGGAESIFFKGGKGATTRVSQFAQEFGGASKPVARKIGEVTVGVARDVPLFLAGGTIGKAGFKVASKIPGAKKFTGAVGGFFEKKVLPSSITKFNPSRGLALGAGIVGLEVGGAGLKGFKETGTVTGGLEFAGLQGIKTAADFAVFGSIVGGFRAGSIKSITKTPSKSEIKNLDIKGTSLITQAQKVRAGEGVTITTTEGKDIVIRIPKQNIFATRSESIGVVKVGENEFPVRISTTSTGEKLVTSGKNTNIINLPNGKIKVEFPGTNKKPEIFTTNTELSTQSNGIIKGTTITTDIKGGKTLTETKTIPVSTGERGKFTDILGRSIVPKGSSFSETQGTVRDLGQGNLLSSKQPGITDIFRTKSASTQSQFGSAKISLGGSKSVSLKVNENKVVEGPIVQAKNDLLRKVGLLPEKSVNIPKIIQVPQTSFKQDFSVKSSSSPKSETIQLQRQVPKSEVVSGQQKAKQIIQQQEATRLQTKGQELKSRAQEFKVQRGQRFNEGITRLNQGSILNVGQRGLEQTFRTGSLQEQLKRSDVKQRTGQIQRPVQDKRTEQIQRPVQDKIPVQDKVPIQRPKQIIDQVITPINKPVIERIGQTTPEGKRPIVPKVPPLTPGLSFGNRFGKFGKSSTLLGIKTNPIKTVKEIFGR